MLHHSCLVCIFYVREGVGSTLVADQKAVALGEVARIVSSGHHLHKTAVAVLAASGRNTLADDAAACVAAYVDHLCSCVSLLIIVCHGHRIELR